MPIATHFSGWRPIRKGVRGCIDKVLRFASSGKSLDEVRPRRIRIRKLGASLFFDPKRIAPGAGEAQMFEILLVVGFGVECLLIGLTVRWFRRRGQGPHAERMVAR